jgi:hypothetical protein
MSLNDRLDGVDVFKSEQAHVDVITDTHLSGDGVEGMYCTYTTLGDRQNDKIETSI